MSRSSILPSVAVVLSLLAGLASARIDEPRYAVTSLRLSGPASIPRGETRPYVLQLASERVEATTPAVSADVVLTLNGRLQPGLYAGGLRLAAGELDLERLRRVGSLTLELACSEREVRGSAGGSGAGARARSGPMGLPWWDQPATVRARLGGLESNPIAILCDG
jgi:hypothetical protein